MILITDDIFFQWGFEQLYRDNDYLSHFPLLIMDDGISNLYFLDARPNSGGHSLTGDAVALFLDRLKIVVPRNTDIERLRSLLQKFQRGAFWHISVSTGQKRVLLDTGRGMSEEMSRCKMGVDYKTWFNFKNAAFSRLGIKNNATYLKAISVWRAGAQEIFCREIIRLRLEESGYIRRSRCFSERCFSSQPYYIPG